MPHSPPGRRPRRVDREQLKADVLRGLIAGLPLSVVARRNGTDVITVNRWERGDPTVAEEVAQARALGWDNLAVECLEIVDDRSEDVILDAKGDPHFNTTAVLRAKARVETRLRLLACWDTGRYGPQKTLRVEGEVNVNQRHTIDPGALDDSGRAALRHVIEQAQARGLLTAPEPVEAEFSEVSPDGED